MAQDAHIDIPADTWTELTNADVTAISVQNLSLGRIYLKGSTSAAPTGGPEGCVFDGLDGIDNWDFPSAFLGVSGAVRVFAYSAGRAAKAWVSHA